MKTNTPAVLTNDTLLLRVYVQPKASKDGFVGVHGDEIKLSITAPPVDGKANKHVIAFIAKQCAVAKSNVTIIRGELSRHKAVEIVKPKNIPNEITQLLDFKSINQ